MIPSFLSFDVEPDAFQIFPDERPKWSGYGAFFEFVQTLRKELVKSAAHPIRFGWYFRTDPQIEQVCGRADAALTSFPRRIDMLRAAGDYFGVHTHPIRWSPSDKRWVHDVADEQWLRDCTHFALDAFEHWNNSPASLFRAGAGYHSDDIIDVLDQRGVTAEMSLEPVATMVDEWNVVRTQVDDSPIVGVFTDLRGAPRVPYRPARENFRIRGGRRARNLVLVPQTSGIRKLPNPGWYPNLRSRIRQTVKPRGPYSLHLWLDCPSDQYYWDLISYQLALMRRPYLSLAIRTDAPDSKVTKLISRRMLALAQHPLAAHLGFVNPIEVMASLLPNSRSHGIQESRAIAAQRAAA